MRRSSLRLCKKRKTENNLQSPATSLKGNSADVVTLDILMEVLNRLPAESVGRFLLVSKSWAKTIRSKGFIRWFPFRSLTQPLRLLISFRHEDLKTGHRSCRFFSSSPLSSSSTSIPASFLSTITWPRTKRLRDMNPSYYVNGLMCNGEVICNPCTGKSITLPSVKTGSRPTRLERCFFGYDPLNDAYKVLRVTKAFRSPMKDPWPDFQVFTLVGAKQESWREIKCSVPHRPYSNGLCIDGAVYYIAHTGTGYILVRFDLKSEKFDIFARVSEDIRARAWNGTVPMTLINYHGKVAASIHPFKFESTIELFVFEAGKQDFYERSFHNLPYPYLRMKGINHMGEIIFAPSIYQGAAKVILYDLKGANYKTIKIEVDANMKWFNEEIYFLGYVESLMLL